MLVLADRETNNQSCSDLNSTSSRCALETMCDLNGLGPLKDFSQTSQ